MDDESDVENIGTYINDVLSVTKLLTGFASNYFNLINEQVKEEKEKKEDKKFESEANEYFSQESLL